MFFKNCNIDYEQSMIRCQPSFGVDPMIIEFWWSQLEECEVNDQI